MSAAIRNQRFCGSCPACPLGLWRVPRRMALSFSLCSGVRICSICWRADLRIAVAFARASPCGREDFARRSSSCLFRSWRMGRIFAFCSSVRLSRSLILCSSCSTRPRAGRACCALGGAAPASCPANMSGAIPTSPLMMQAVIVRIHSIRISWFLMRCRLHRLTLLSS